jgi:hypothetical protein
MERHRMSSAWGFEWGTVTWGEGALDASDRLLMFVRSPRLSGFVNVLGDRTSDLIDASILAAAAFDLDTAVGVHLDRLGAILQLPRYGYADDRYRVLLQIQAQLVLSSTTATSVILRIVELFTGHAPLSYADAYPMGFRIGVELDDPTDAALLLQILGNAKAAAYSVEVIVGDASDTVIGDYSIDPLALAAKDIGDYSIDPIAGAGTGAYSFYL